MRKWLLAIGLGLLMCLPVLAQDAPAGSQDTPEITQEGALPGMPPVVLPAPPLRAKLLPARKPAPTLRLKLISRKRNEIVDDAEWFTRNNLEVPSAMPESIAARFDVGDGLVLQEAHLQNEILFGMFASEASPAYVLIAYKGPFAQYAFDFQNFRVPERQVSVRQPLVFAQQSGDILYVSHAGNGYAKDWNGNTGYITAIDLKSKSLLWRSQPLVANANNFLILDQVIVTGYGFTAEPDYLYLLDKKTGQLLQRLSVPSAPNYILRKGNRVYVRCYDTDLVYAIQP
ncbi:MAG: hypothetical protein OHK0029_42580 [Armatimonadaceae bacterium]